MIILATVNIPASLSDSVSMYICTYVGMYGCRHVCSLVKYVYIMTFFPAFNEHYFP